MSDSLTIAVGTRDLLPTLQGRPEVAGTPIQLFPPDDIRAALEAILGRRPRYLVLDREFSHGGRGAAMIDRLRADPAFGATQILIVSGGTITPLPPGGDVVPAPAGLDWRGTRRVPRIRMRSGIDAQVDGNAAALIDLSTLGAQVVSSAPLRPNQRLRLSLPSDGGVRLVATIAWASFELPKGRPTPQYRAGMEFTSPNTALLERFCVSYAHHELSAGAARRDG